MFVLTELQFRKNFGGWNLGMLAIRNIAIFVGVAFFRSTPTYAIKNKFLTFKRRNEKSETKRTKNRLYNGNKSEKCLKATRNFSFT